MYKSFPIPTAAAYYHNNKICFRSSNHDDMWCVQPAVSVWDLIGSRTNSQYWKRVGMSSPEGGGTRCWYVTWRWLLWRQMISSPPWWSPWDIEMDGVEMESGWMVTTLHSVCDSNVTGGDRHHLRSHSFNPNDKGGCHFLPVRSNLHSASFKNSHKARWEVIGKDGKTCLLCPICGQRREQAKSLENTKRRSLQMKRGGQGWVSLSPTASCILVCIHA